MARNLPAGAIYFGVFENTKNYFASRNESGAATDLQIMAAGGSAASATGPSSIRSTSSSPP